MYFSFSFITVKLHLKQIEEKSISLSLLQIHEVFKIFLPTTKFLRVQNAILIKKYRSNMRGKVLYGKDLVWFSKQEIHVTL